MPGPRGLEHLRIMERAATYINLAVVELHERYGDVFTFGFGPIRFVWLVGADAHRFALQEHPDSFTLSKAYSFLRPIGGDNALIASDEPDHLRRRRLVQPAFHKRRLERIVSIIASYNDALFDTWEADKRPATVDLYQQTRPTVLAIICETLLGADTLRRYPGLVDGVSTMMNFANLPFLAQQFKLDLPGVPWRRFVRARRQTDAALYEDISRRRQHAETGDDVLAMLLGAKDETGEGLSDVEVRDQALSLVSAGFDTTSATLAWAVYLLLEHPDVLDRLREEVDGVTGTVSLEMLGTLPLLDRVVKETLRLYPAAPAGLRYLERDLDYKGVRLPAGSQVALSIYATHRSSKYYDAPLAFRPERWADGEEAPEPFSYLPFGALTRYCIGSSLANTIIKLSLVQLLRRFDVAPAWPSPVQETGNTVQPKGGLPVRVTPR